MPSYELALQLDDVPLPSRVVVRRAGRTLIAVDEPGRRWALDTGQPSRGGAWADFQRSDPALLEAHQACLAALTRDGGEGPVDWELVAVLASEGRDDDAIARAVGTDAANIATWRGHQTP